MFKYQARKGNLTAGELKSFFCHNEESPFKLNDKHHLLYKPIELEEAFISFFLQNGNEVSDDFIFSKDIKLKAKLSIGAYFYPFQFDMDGHRSVIYVFMMKNTKISEIAKLFQNKLQLSPIKFKYSKSFSKPETMTSNASINSYKVTKFITIILPDFKTFGFRIEPKKTPLFYLNLSYKTPIKVIQGRVADEINKRFKIETHITPKNIQLFLKKGHPLTNLAAQLKSLKEQDKIILVEIKDTVLPQNPSYLFLFPDSSVPKLFELDNDVTVEDFLMNHVSNSKEASLYCKGDKLKRNVKFSELGITMANLIIVKFKGSKTLITIKLPHESFQIKFKNFYQIRDLKEKVKEKIGSTPFELFYKGQKLEDEKICRDYGIDGVVEITAQLLKPASSSSSLFLYNDSSLSVFDTPVEGNPVFFVAKDRRPLSHTFEKKATVAEAKKFIMASWMVKNIEFLLNGRHISEKAKLSKLPISKKIPIAVIIKDQYNEVLEVKTSLGMSNDIKEIRLDMICENNGQMATFNVKDNPTVGDVIRSIKDKLGISENHIEIVYHDKIYSDKKMLLSNIEQNALKVSDSETEDSEYIDSIENSISDSDDSDFSDTTNSEEDESSESDKNKKSKKENKDSDSSNDNDDENIKDEDEKQKIKSKSKEDKSKHEHSHKRHSKELNISEIKEFKNKNKDKDEDEDDTKKEKKKEKDSNETKKGKNKEKERSSSEIEKEKAKNKVKERSSSEFKKEKNKERNRDSGEFKKEKERNKEKERSSGEIKKDKEKNKNKEENESKKSKNKDKEETETQKEETKEKKKDDGKQKEKHKDSKTKDDVDDQDQDEDEEGIDENNSPQELSDDISRDGNYFYFRLTLESTSTEQDYINLYSKFSNRQLRRVSKLENPVLNGVPIVQPSNLIG